MHLCVELLFLLHHLLILFLFLLLEILKELGLILFIFELLVTISNFLSLPLVNKDVV